MNTKLLLIISLLTTMLLVVACGGAQPDVAASAQSDTVSQQETLAPEPTAAEMTSQPVEEVQSSDSAENDLPDPQPASTNTVIAAALTWDDAIDIMRSGRILNEISVYESPNTDAEIVGEQEAGDLVIVTRALDDWYEIIYNDGACPRLAAAISDYLRCAVSRNSGIGCHNRRTCSRSDACLPSRHRIRRARGGQIGPISAPSKLLALFRLSKAWLFSDQQRWIHLQHER